MPDVASVTVRSPAKVNLALGVGAPREDGFHPLATVYQAIGVYDDVTVARATETTVTVAGEGVDVVDVPTDAANLALRAVHALAEHHGVPAADSGVTMHVVKRIPVSGGMAGGSTDAAAALVAVDRLWGLRTPAADLAAVAARLGSDVPFCLVGGTATGHGRGEVVAPVPDRTTCWWVAALPGGGLSTPSVYRRLDRLRGGGALTDPVPGHVTDPVPDPGVVDVLLAALERGSVDAVARAVSNELEPAALSLRPELTDVLQLGRSAGALVGLVSGSGPTCLFLAGDADHAERLAARLRDDGLPCMVAHGPVPGAQVRDPL